MSKDIFKTNPNLKEAYKTSDENYFYSKNAAQNHAKTLENKTIQELVNPSEKVVLVNADPAKLSPKKQAQKDYTDKFDEVPSEEFTTKQLLEAIEKGAKLGTEIQS